MMELFWIIGDTKKMQISWCTVQKILLKPYHWHGDASKTPKHCIFHLRLHALLLFCFWLPGLICDTCRACFCGENRAVEGWKRRKLEADSGRCWIQIYDKMETTRRRRKRRIGPRYNGRKRWEEGSAATQRKWSERLQSSKKRWREEDWPISDVMTERRRGL